MKTPEQIQKWILNNCVDEYGNIVMNDLDFGDKTVFLNRMKAKIISQSRHKANRVSQIGHEANEISQWRHKADVMEGEHIKKLTLEEEVKMLREEIERLKKQLNKLI